MKKFLSFQTDGTIIEEHTKNVIFKEIDYKYEFCYKCIYKNEYYIVLTNINNINIKNISIIPFLENNINGVIYILKVNDFQDYRIKSLTENSYSKIFNSSKEYFDYSSDDFNPDTCDKLKNC